MAEPEEIPSGRWSRTEKGRKNVTWRLLWSPDSAMVGRVPIYEGGVTVTTGGRENYTHTVGRRALCPLLDMEGDCPQLFHHHMKIL